MPYTLRPTWPDNPDSRNDYVFRHDGCDVGRCYFTRLAGGIDRWHWTIYIGGGPGRASRSVDGIPIAGNTAALEEAKAEFKESFDAMIAAGVVSDPPG